jgi:uncharacterized YceG family protein
MKFGFVPDFGFRASDFKLFMRILFLNYEYPPLGGGAANATDYILEEYSKIPDLTVDLVTSSIDGEYHLEKSGENIFIHRLPIGKNKNNLHYQSQKELLAYAWKAYFFSKKLTSEEIVKKMLNNFDSQLTLELRDEIAKQGKSLEEVVTMASIIEKEVISEKDRKIASGIFWDRIKNGQPLQSCATISYVLGTNKKQYTFEDTRIQSPYNTYLNQGLPPGPICNPGISAIRAAIYPTNTDYNYFLSDPETGNTVFSKTIEEHNSNKVKYGL